MKLHYYKTERKDDVSYSEQIMNYWSSTYNSYNSRNIFWI